MSTADKPTLASADPASRRIDAANAIHALAAEQGQASPLPVLVARLRGDAARAMEALRASLPDGSGAPFHDACVQSIILRGSAPIPTATLLAWSTAWRAP